VDEETRGILERGIVIFNEEKFYEAHDVWEDHWLNVSGDERLFFQGLIQTAAAFYKLQLGNPRGMARLLADALEALGGVTGQYGVDLPGTRAFVASWKKVAEEMVSSGRMEYDERSLPRLVYVPTR